MLNVYKSLVLLVGLTSATVSTAVTISINEIHSCLALTNFVDSKVSTASKTYTASEMSDIHKGLKSYSDYLDHDVIDPKLLKLYGGKAAQANLMKKLFSRQQASFTRYLSDRYAEEKIPTDYAIAIRECSIKTHTANQSDVYFALEKAINVMIKS